MSLTVNEIKDDAFRLTLIPHTQDAISFDGFDEGCKVNLEVDVLARYLERLFNFDAKKNGTNKSQGSGITMQTLLKNGFI